MELKKVREYLPLVKATRYAFINLDKQTIERFKKLYKYLLKHKENHVYFIGDFAFNNIMQKSKELGEYTTKFQAMQEISANIKF